MRGWSARAPRRRAKLGLLLLPQRGSPPCTKVRMSPRRQRPQAAQTQTRPSWSAWMQVQIWPICDFFPLPVVEIMSNLNLLLFFFFSGSMLRRWDLVTRAKSLMRTTLLRWTTYRYSSQSCVRCVKTNSKKTKTLSWNANCKHFKSRGMTPTPVAKGVWLYNVSVCCKHQEELQKRIVEEQQNNNLSVEILNGNTELLTGLVGNAQALKEPGMDYSLCQSRSQFCLCGCHTFRQKQSRRLSADIHRPEQLLSRYINKLWSFFLWQQIVPFFFLLFYFSETAAAQDA